MTSWNTDGNTGTNPRQNFIGTTDNQPLVVRANDNEILRIVPSQRVGIRTDTPAVSLHIVGNRIRLENGNKVLDLRADGGAVDVQATNHNLYLHSNGPADQNHVLLNPHGGEGNVGIGTASPDTKLNVRGNRIRLENGGRQLDLRADGGAVDIESSTHNLYLHSNGPNGNNHVLLNPHGGEGNVGIGTNHPTQKLHVQGNIAVSGDIQLLGADCAEEFDIDPDVEIEPGTVMVINGERLQESSQPYDKRVAGVVSGAESYRPGIVLDNQGKSDGRLPIALLGKVFCKVDASAAPIEVGDLLTTSSIPGHAMKALDPLTAFGSIIGKALRPLDSGRNLIPILVALQ